MTAGLGGGGGLGCEAWLTCLKDSQPASQQDHVGGQNKVTQQSVGPGRLPIRATSLGAKGLAPGIPGL